MTIHQILSCFLLGIKRSSLLDWSKQFPEVDYALLTAFFKLPFNAQKMLLLAAIQLFDLQNGYFVLDEIVIERSKIGSLPVVKHRYKSDGGYITPAISIVLLLWTDGRIRVPIQFELREPGTGSHVDSALRLLSWARNQWQKKPDCVLFDAGFCSMRLLERINNYGWAFVCRITKTRKLNEMPLWQFKKQGYWNEIGNLSSGLKVRAIRRKGKFYVTNRVSWDAQEVVKLYSKRHIIEEAFKILKGLCHWKGCQLRTTERFERFLSVGALAFIVWEDNRIKLPDSPTIYELRQKAILQRFEPRIPDFDCLLDSIQR